MRVCFSAYVVNPSSGSESGNAWRWIKGVSDLGNEVIVLTTPEQAGIIESHILNNLNVIPIPKVLPRYLELGILGMYIQARLWQRRIAKLIRKNLLPEFDIGHHVSWGSFRIGCGLSASISPIFFGPGGMAKPRTYAYKWLKVDSVKEVLRDFVGEYVFGNTRFVKESFSDKTYILAANSAAKKFACKKRAKNIIKCLPEGVDKNQILNFEVSSVARQNKVIWVGRFLPIKAPNLALETWKKVLASMPDAVLIMVGDGPQLEKTKRMAAKMNIQKSVQFTGVLEWHTVQKMYSTAKCHFFSTLRDSTGAQVMEAAAKGTPTVATISTGMSEWIDEPASFFIAPSKEAALPQLLADKIISILNATPEEWNRMSHSALQFATRHLWESKVETVEGMYKEVLSQETK